MLMSPKPGLGSSVLASLSILSIFLCAWNTWTSSGFSLSCWKRLPRFILALSTLNVALHCMGGSLVHDLPSVFLQHLLVPWESSWTQRRNLSNSSRDRWKKKVPTLIRFWKWGEREVFQELGLNFAVPAAWRTHQVLGSKDLPMVWPRESHNVQSLEHQLFGLVLGF